MKRNRHFAIVTEVVNVFSASFDSFGLNFEEGGYIFEGNFSVFPKLKTYRTLLFIAKSRSFGQSAFANLESKDGLDFNGYQFFVIYLLSSIYLISGEYLIKPHWVHKCF